MASRTPMVAALLSCIAALAQGDITVASFDGSSKLVWETVNDPVMGGQSVSSIKIDNTDSVAEWTGQVRIVPFLHAPGFCTARGSGVIPDLGSYKGLAISLAAKPGTNLTKYQLQFESSDKGGSDRGGGFIADFTLPSTDTQIQKIFVPFADFEESWRGEKVGGAPTLKQLASIEQVGIGADGAAGNFDILISTIVATDAAPPAPSPSGPGVELISFKQGSKNDHKWFVVNDPVMGGRSRSTFVEDTDKSVGIFNGTVAIVPQLKAPGFCNAEARIPIFDKKFPDASAYLKGGLTYKIASKGRMNVFKAAFGTSSEYNFGSYKADFVVPNTGNMETVFIPFTSFSNKWSASTGEPILKCSEHPEVCPTAKSLADIGSVGIWAEGTAGDFHVEIESISATFAPVATVCNETEYCCPDAKHCLTPTKTSCASDQNVCAPGDVCCPLTKICVTPGAPCSSPCADQGSYCCPDAKHCLTPTNPGTFCDSDNACNKDKGEVCCPLTKLCVTVGAACTPPFMSV